MKKSLEYIFGDNVKSLEAKFLPEVIELNYLNAKTGARESKYIDYDSFFTAVNTSTVINTGLMAPGIRYLSKSNGKTIILIEDFPKPQTLTFHTKYPKKDEKPGEAVYQNIPMPGVLVAIELKEGLGIQNALVWAIKKPIQLQKDQVYIWPLGNSFGGAGGFCWGTSVEHFKSIKNVHHARSIFTLIYGSKSNDDLQTYVDMERLGLKNGPEDERSSKAEEFTKIYKFLQDKENFPMDCLRSCGDINMVISNIETGRH